MVMPQESYDIKLFQIFKLFIFKGIFKKDKKKLSN